MSLILEDIDSLIIEAASVKNVGPNLKRLGKKLWAVGNTDVNTLFNKAGKKVVGDKAWKILNTDVGVLGGDAKRKVSSKIDTASKNIHNVIDTATTTASNVAAFGKGVYDTTKAIGSGGAKIISGVGHGAKITYLVGKRLTPSMRTVKNIGKAGVLGGIGYAGYRSYDKLNSHGFVGQGPGLSKGSVLATGAGVGAGVGGLAYAANKKLNNRNMPVNESIADLLIESSERKQSRLSAFVSTLNNNKGKIATIGGGALLGAGVTYVAAVQQGLVDDPQLMNYLTVKGEEIKKLLFDAKNRQGISDLVTTPERVSTWRNIPKE